MDFINLRTCNLIIVRRHKISRRQAPRLGFKFARAFRFFFVCCFVIPSAWAQTPALPLTNAIDVISLPAESASRSLKVLVTGVVTAAAPSLQGRFFMQDATSGVFVDNANGRRPEPGELVEVSGITYAGAYAPTITAPTVRVLGKAPLPAAKIISVEE